MSAPTFEEVAARIAATSDEEIQEIVQRDFPNPDNTCKDCGGWVFKEFGSFDFPYCTECGRKYPGANPPLDYDGLRRFRKLIDETVITI